MGFGGSLASTIMQGTINREVVYCLGGGGVTIEYTLPFVKDFGISVGAVIGAGNMEIQLYRNNGEFNWEDTPGGIDVTKFGALNNKEKLPVCIIGGCHNSQFNVTLMATTLQEPYMWTHGMPVSECFAWLRQEKLK